MANGLTPLLISHFHYESALPVLYAHPHISEKSIGQFIRDVQKPARYNDLDSKVPLIRHLTVRPSPIDTKSSPSAVVRPNTSTQLPELASLFPTIRSLTLRETLIERGDDALNVFRALSLTLPEKLRLEIRMWKLSDLARCDDVLVSTRPDTHSEQTRAAPLAVPRVTVTRHPDGRTTYTAVPQTTSFLHAAWRDALYTGTEVDFPMSREAPETPSNGPVAQPQTAILTRSGIPPASAGRLGVLLESARRRALSPEPPNPASAYSAFPPHIASMITRRFGFQPNTSQLHRICHVFAREYNLPRDYTANERAYMQVIDEARKEANLTYIRARQIIERLGFTRRDGRHSAQPPPYTSSQVGPPGVTPGPHSMANAAAVLERALMDSPAVSTLLAGTNPGGDKPVIPAVTSSVPSTDPPAYLSVPSDPNIPRRSELDAEDLRQAEEDMLQEGIRASRSFIDATSNPTAGPSCSRDITPGPSAYVSPQVAAGWDQEDFAAEKSKESGHEDIVSAKTDSQVPDTLVDATPAPATQAEGEAQSDLIGPITDAQDTILPPSSASWKPTIDSFVAAMAATAQADDSTEDDEPRSLQLSNRILRERARGFAAGRGRSATAGHNPGPSAQGTDSDSDSDGISNHEAVPQQTLPQAAPRALSRRSMDAILIDNMTRRHAGGSNAGGGSAGYPTHNPPPLGVMNQREREPVNDLPTTFRALLRTLLEGTWAGKLQAFSFVALDPLASMIVRSPQLDLWPHVSVPHIRVHLPRGVNSLAVFMGMKEESRHRARRNGAASDGPPDPTDTGHEPIGFTAASQASVAATVSAVIDPDAPAPAGAAPTYGDARPSIVTDFIVGGDGFGGDLVHPDNKLFEIEVNTVKEMTDELWTQAGSQLPPQVCRILTGSSDWAEVVIGKFICSLT